MKHTIGARWLAHPNWAHSHLPHFFGACMNVLLIIKLKILVLFKWLYRSSFNCWNFWYKNRRFLRAYNEMFHGTHQDTVNCLYTNWSRWPENLPPGQEGHCDRSGDRHQCRKIWNLEIPTWECVGPNRRKNQNIRDSTFSKSMQG